MENGTNNMMNDQMIDNIACDALGANTPEQSAAYQQSLAAAGEPARKLDRDLRATVAKLAAASPALEPPSDLRGKILQATAPATFRMEDYRRANKEPSRFYKWGFYAAMLFLMAGAWYNLDIKNRFKSEFARNEKYKEVLVAQQTAMRSLVNPQTKQINITGGNGARVGTAFVDEITHTAIVVMPEGVLPANGAFQLTMQNEGKTVAYNTIAVSAPRDVFPNANVQQLQEALDIKDIHQDPNATIPVYNATFGGR